MISEAEAGWVAAVLQVKATCYRKKNKMRATPQVVIYVDSSDKEVVRALSALTGVGRELRAFKGAVPGWAQRGCREHCPGKHVSHYPAGTLETERWTITGAAAAVVLWNVMPLMQGDAGAFRAVYDEILGQVAMSGMGSGAVFKAVSRLVSLGWRMPPVMAEAILEGRKEQGG